MEGKKVQAFKLSDKRIVTVNQDGVSFDMVIPQTLFYWKGYDGSANIIGAIKTGIGEIEIPFATSLFSEQTLIDFGVIEVDKDNPLGQDQ